MKRLAITLSAILAVASAWGQGAQSAPKVVGQLKAVQGLVTVGTGDKLSNAVSGAPLVVGSRIITTSSGGVTLSYDNGCDVTLKANESITVKEGSDCAALLAGVLPVGAPAVPMVAGAAAGGASALVPALILAGSAAGAVAFMNINSNSSPN